MKLGEALRRFQAVTCSSIRTVELPKEAETRLRREIHQVTAKPDGRDSVIPQKRKSLHKTVTRREVNFSLNTYKLHALGDYASFVRKFGTTDSYTTQTVKENLTNSDA